VARFRDSLRGGDAENGRQIFLHKTEVSCLRCHKVRGEGGEVGPDLSGIGSRQPREYLLESIVAPNRQISKGFETVVLYLSTGRTVQGVVKAEDAGTIRLVTPEGEAVTVAKDQIEDRQTGKSAMPDAMMEQLSPFELRDLVEFLAGLKDAGKEPPSAGARR
jgi:quinoprotein glucose dehydrogenase